MRPGPSWQRYSWRAVSYLRQIEIHLQLYSIFRYLPSSVRQIHSKTEAGTSHTPQPADTALVKSLFLLTHFTRSNLSPFKRHTKNGLRSAQSRSWQKSL